jgi:hypothetical protein
MSNPDFAQPYADTPRDRLDELEAFNERPAGLGSPLLPGPIMGADPMGQMLGAVEGSIEGTTIPALGRPEAGSRPQLPVLSEAPVQDFPSQEPPAPWDGGESKVSFISIEVPEAARPYYTQTGIVQPHQRPLGRQGTGIRNAEHTEADELRFCRRDEELVSPEVCLSCAHWGDHNNSGIEWCDYSEDEESRRDDDEESAEYAGE